MPDEKVKVVVPSSNDFQMGSEHRRLWNRTLSLIEYGRRSIKDDQLVYSIILSRVTREIRRTHGDNGKQVLQGLVDTMDDIVKYDEI